MGEDWRAMGTSKTKSLMSSFCSSNFHFTFFKFVIVTYVPGCYSRTPQHTECKQLLFDATWIALQDRICLRNSLSGGGEQDFF